MKILITGSTGLIGSALCRFLAGHQHKVYRLVRRPAKKGMSQITWDPIRGLLRADKLEGFDAVINLAGENIVGHWSAEKKNRILDSRVKGTQLLCSTLHDLQTPPKVLINASAIGYYGNQGDEFLTEDCAKGTGFLAEVCQQWEASTELAVKRGIRTILLRIGMVLSAQGGGLKAMLWPFRLCLGGPIGSGQQYISWIALDDLVNIINFGLQRTDLHGPINAVTPYPVTNLEFVKTLGSVLHRPARLSLPAFVVGALLGQFGQEVLLASQRVRPAQLKRAGFRWTYPKLQQALEYNLRS